MEFVRMKKEDCRNSWRNWCFWTWSFKYHGHTAHGFRLFGLHFELGDIFESAHLQMELEKEFGEFENIS